MSNGKSGSSNTHTNTILKNLKSSRNNIVNQNGYIASSDSDVAEAEARKINPKAAVVRREYKASQLAAIAMTVFSSSKSDLQDVADIQASREKDHRENPNADIVYQNKTRSLLEKRAREMKKTSLYHNPYLRRAFRQAVDYGFVLDATSQDYTDNQSKIRDGLLKVIKDDNEKMKWTRNDFASDIEWQAVQYMHNNVLSNGSNSVYTGDALVSGGNVSGTTAKAAFHHVAWKKALGGLFESHSVNPANLVLRNDTRSSKSKPNRVRGNHENDHIVSGYSADDEWAPGDRKGGVFVDMDPEAVSVVIPVLTQLRTPKAQIYARSRAVSDAVSKNPNAQGSVISSDTAKENVSVLTKRKLGNIKDKEEGMSISL